MKKIINSGEGYFVDKKDPSRCFYGIPPEIDEIRNQEWKAKNGGDFELTAFKKIYDSLGKINLRLINRGSSVKKWLKEGGINMILDKRGKKIWLSKADGEDLEKFVIYKCRTFGWEMPEGYYDRE